MENENKEQRAVKERALSAIVDGIEQITISMEDDPEKVEDDLLHAECLLRLEKAYELVENTGKEEKRLDRLEKQVKDLAKYCH